MASTLRAWAVIALGLLIATHVLRLVAGRCSGAACDAYILPSLALPVLTLVAVAVTAAAGLRASRRQQGWFWAFAIGGVFSVFGPLVALAVLRDQPDVLVPAATVLFPVEPLVALAYAWGCAGRPRS